MRIGISCNVLGRGGGMERHAKDLISGLNRLGQRPIVFAREFREIEGDFEAVRVGVGWAPSKLRDHLFSARLSKLRRQHAIDVLIGCNRTSSADIALCGGTHLGYLRAMRKSPGLWDRLQIGLERSFYDRASVVVAHSHAMEAELRELYGIAANKIVVHHPPVDLSRFHPVDDVTRARHRQALGFPDGTVVFAFPSTGHRRKGFDLLIEAFDSVKLPVLLVVAGRPVGIRRPWLRELGWVSDMAALYCAADFTIMASGYEPFGLVGVESIGCGTPLVTSDALGCREVIDPAVRIDFRRSDRRSLVGALEAAVERVRAGGHRYGVSSERLHYDPAVVPHVGKLLSIAETLLAERSA